MNQTPGGNLLGPFLGTGQLEGKQKYIRFDRLAEIFTWAAIVLGLFVIQLPFGPSINRTAIYVLDGAIGVFAIIWFHLLPKRLSGRTKSFIYNLIIISFISVVVHYTNGVQGYTIFLYFLSSLAVVMTLPITYIIITAVYVIALIFIESFLTAGPLSTNLSLALLHSWSLILVVFFTRFNAGEAAVVKRQHEEITLDKEKTIGKLKDEFVYIISHELKQPAAAIKGYIGSILAKYEDSLRPEDKEVLNLTNTNSDRLTKLLDDLLDVSQIEKGSLRIKMADVSLKPIVSEVLSTLLLEAKSKRISLMQRAVEEIGAKADVDRLKEVLTNLLGNAIKYTPEGGRVVIEVRKEEEVAKVLVSDNGVGISEEDQKHLFEKFYRVENENTKAVKGNGLGLFIAKQLVEKMGGQIGVVSKPGEGTTFYFTLPRYRW